MGSAVFKTFLQLPTKRWHLTKVNISLSLLTELIEGVPQGSALVQIFTKICFIWLKLTDVCNFANVTAIHASDSSLHLLINRLEDDASIVVR